jgi:hypothetical protein
MAGLKLITAPASEPISTSDAKSFLRVDTSDDNALIDRLVKTARIFCEEYTGRALINQTYEFYIDAFSEVDTPLWEGIRIGADINLYKNYINLPRPPLSSVTSIYTYDDADTGTLFPTTSYYVDSIALPGRIVLRNGQTWPSSLRTANGVKVTYIAGYGSSASDIPEALITGMKEHVSYLYENRGDDEKVNNIPIIAKQLYMPYRILSFSSNPFSNNTLGKVIF